MSKVSKRLLARLVDPQTRSVTVRAYAQIAVGWLHFASAIIPWRPRITYRAYAPDSVWVFRLHPELQRLVAKWTEGRRRNNAGDLGRFYALALNIKQILKDGIPGDFAELGVYRGNSAAVLAAFAAQANRKVFLFDTFGGFDERDLIGVDRKSEFKRGFSDTSIGDVQRLVGEPAQTVYIEGYFPDSLTPNCDRVYSFVHIDCDLFEPMMAALEFFYPRVAPGGTLFLHDYASGPWGGTKAIDDFCSRIGEGLVLLPDKSGTAVIRKKKLTCQT